MATPESFPFLRIARQFGIPYADVLALADALRHSVLDDSGAIRATFQRDHEFESDIFDNPAIASEIAMAAYEQGAVRRGLIDWQTGEPTQRDKD